jgi:hypothetical protein
MSESLNYLIATAGGYKPPGFDFLDAQRKALEIKRMQQEVDAYPEDKAWQQEQRQAARQKFQWMTEDRAKELEMQPIKDDTEKMKYLLTIGPMITFDKYGQSRDWLINKNKIPEFVLPPAQAFMDKAKELGTDPGELFEKWKGATLTSADQKLREQLGMARIESAEKIAGAKIEGAEKLAGARLDAYRDRQDLLFKHQKDLEDLRAQHAKELAEAKGAAREGKDLLSRQKEARLSVFKLYGMGEFSQYDEGLSDKAGKALEEANRMLAKDPELDPMTAAAQAKRRVDRQYKAIEGIQNPKNRKETTQAIRNSLDGGVDTADLLQALLKKGWSRQDAIQVIRDAAAIQ